jgi:hypothetical protein
VTWVAWRQQRALLFLLAGLVTVGALALVYLGTEMHSFVVSHRLTSCVLDSADCPVTGDADAKFNERYGPLLGFARMVLLAAPVLVGMFLGAPLFAREFENRTHLLALGQAVTVRRWTAVKIAVAVVPALAGVAVLTFAYARMTGTGGALLLRQETLFGATFFEAQGLMPVAYTLFALLAGIAFGLLLRSTVGALAATLGLFAVARIALQLVRERLLPPSLLQGPILTGDLPYPALPDGALLVRSGYVDRAGLLVGEESLPAVCRSVGAGPQPVEGAGSMTEMTGCLRSQGFTGTAQYFHGPDHYWILQLIEGGILVAVGAVLLVAGVWRFHTRPR